MTRSLVPVLVSLSLVSGAAAGPALEQTLVGRPFAANGPARDLALAQDGELVLGSCDGRVVLWEASSGRRLGELPGDGHYDSLLVVGDKLITAEDSTARIQVWDVSRRELLAELWLDPSHEPLGELSTGIPPEPVVALARSPDGSLLAAAWKDEVRLLRLSDLELVRLLRLPHEHVEPKGGDWTDLHTVDWDADGRVLRAWNTQHRQGWSWDVSRASLPTTLPAELPPGRTGDEWTQAVSALRDGDVVELRAARNDDLSWRHRLVRLDAQGGERWSTPVPARDVIWNQSLLALEDRGMVLLSGRVAPATFSLADGAPTPTQGPSGLRGLFSSPRDGTLILWDDLNGLWAWDAASRSGPLRLATPLPDADRLGARVELLDVDPSQRYAAAELHDGQVLLWELRSGQLLRRWRDGDEPNQTGLAVRARAAGPRCFYNAFHGEGRLRIEDERTIVDYGRGVYLVARDTQGQVSFSRDPRRGTRFVLAADARTLLADDATRLVDLETGAEREVSHALRFVTGQAIGPGGRSLAVAGIHNRQQWLQVFEVRADGVAEVRREILSGITQDVVFSADGCRLAAVDRLGAVALNLTTGSRTRIELPGGAAAAFLPDGRLAIGSRDGSVTVWSLRD